VGRNTASPVEATHRSPVLTVLVVLAIVEPELSKKTHARKNRKLLRADDLAVVLKIRELGTLCQVA
jgi:hypothetical protein